ncbi:mechanosensitive ion channel family protein [Microvirga subterranea]|uniref:MscS family membrane protein n=1 Tax=Microvirga subterranea TaxID=186651 RepID=A0A370HQM7_9HYPH|nr:mechanosensitive ion channel domain-containing protein [Microvirga subterranea]RDI60827.1 MscS family membrane protein [Microvirga subterranea]
MTMPSRRPLQEAVVPIVCVLLAAFFVVFQFLATPPALGSLRFLAAAETSSPRATLEGFRSNVARASSLLLEAYRENNAEPGFFQSQSVKDKVKEAEGLLAQAARALDLRDVPPVELEHRRLEAPLLLKEILDRLPLPDPGTIPGDADISKQAIPNWNVPGTEIRIARVSDGPRTGEYLFSRETVRQLDAFYEAIRTEPNVSGSGEDLYDFYSQSPGYLLPPKWYSLVEALPAGLRRNIQGQALWQWIALVLVLVVAVLAVLGIQRLARSRRSAADASISLPASILVPAAVAVAALFVSYMSDYQINLTGSVNDIIDEVSEAAAYLAAMWGILKFSNSLANHLTFTKSESIDAHLARASIRIGGIAAALGLLIYGASYLGIPLAGLLAGLGVGGLAVALAAKPTLENFIGGLILYADRPVRVGDLCRFGNLEGRVQEIGIRSTRIRGLDRSLITIPNATFVNMNIINLTNRDRMPYDRTISIQAADSAGIRREIEALASLVAEHPKIEAGSVQVRLREGQEEKPKAEIQALILTSKWEEFLVIQQEIDLMLRDKVLAEVRTAGETMAAFDNVVPLKEAEDV